LLQDRDTLEGEERPNVLPARELRELGSRWQRVDEGGGETFSIGGAIEEVGRQSRIRQPASNRSKDRSAVEVLRRLESCFPQRPHQGRYRRLTRPGRGVVAGHLRQKLSEAGFHQPLRAKEPDPADLLPRQATIACLAADHFGMTLNRRRDLVNREEVGQLHAQRDGWLCDATLHCSKQRRKVAHPTSYSQWKLPHPGRSPSAGPS